MHNSQKIHVLEYKGRSYIHIEYMNISTLLVNNQVPQECVGNKRWCFINGSVNTIQQKMSGKSKLDKFVIKEHFQKHINTLPLEVPSYSFNYDEDECQYVGNNVEFYEPVYTQEPDTFVDLEFIVIDKDCKPVDLPPYIHVNFPHDLDNYPETWHKYPCSIGARDVFKLLLPKIEEISRDKKTSNVYEFHIYDSLELIDVKLRIPLPEKLITSKVYKIGKKKFTEEYKYNKLPFIRIAVNYKENIGGPFLQIEHIEGNNYKDLQKKIDDFINGIVDMFDIGKYVVCEHCHGHGLINIEE